MEFFLAFIPPRSSTWSSIPNSRFLSLMRITCKFYLIFIGNGIIVRTIYISISTWNHKLNGIKSLFYKSYQSVDYHWANSQNKQQNHITAEIRVVTQGKLLNQNSNHPCEESNSFFLLG